MSLDVNPPNASQGNRLETYCVEQYELHVTTYEIDAQGAAHAIRRVLDGAASIVEPSPELCGIPSDLGMTIEENCELHKQLQALGVPLTGTRINSIRSVS